MPNFSFRRRDQAALDFINECVEQAHNVRKEYEPQWFENWANYRVEPYHSGSAADKRYPLASGGTQPHRLSPVNFLKTPESHQGVNTLRALLLAGLFGVRDYVQATPSGDEDVQSALNVSRLVMHGLERPGNFRTNWDVLGDGLICGLGSYTGRWRREDRLVPRRMPVPDPNNPQEFLRDPNTGSILTVLQNQYVPVFDDPVIETDDLWDTWFDPAATRFHDLQYKVKRFKIRDETLNELRDNPNWDAAGIAEVLRNDPTYQPDGPDSLDHPKLVTENLTEEDIKDIKSYGYYGGWLFEGVIDKETASAIGGIDHRGKVILRIINGILVQAMQSGQRFDRIHGGTLTILPTGKNIYGISPLTIVRYLQDVSDTQLILTTQALIESVYQNYVIGGGEGPNFKRDIETRRPREAFVMQGEVNQIAPLPKDYTGVQIAVGALNVISQTIRQAMNARDPVQGQVRQTGETTATEINAVTAGALQNTDQLAVLIERDELPILGHLINDLFYVNLEDDGKVFQRVGDTEVTRVSYFDIDAVNDINFVGARSALTRSQKANQFRDFAMMLSSNPFTAAATDWHELVRRYGDEALDVKGLEQLMLTDPEEIVARMQAAGLANTVQPSKGGAGPSGGSPQSKPRRSPSSGGRSGGSTDTQNAGESS